MKKLFLLAALASTLLIACQNQQSENIRETDIASNKSDMSAETNNTPEAPDQIPATTRSSNSKEAVAPTPNINWDRNIIRTANLKLEIKDLKTYYKPMLDRIRAIGGYIAQEELAENDFERTMRINIRIPVDQFDAAVESITTPAEKTLERNISSQDVSEEMVDTKARLQTKEQLRSRYNELLRQSNKLDDIIKMEGQINDVQEQIERGMGRIQFLQHSATYSTINLTAIQFLSDAPRADNNPENENAFIKAVKLGWEGLRVIILALISIWPVILILFTAIWIVKRKAHKNNTAHSSIPTA